MSVGIYSIRNTRNGKRYVGSAVNIVRARWPKHKRELRNKEHHSLHLQNAWYKYGAESFVFEIIEECEKEKLLEREQHWMNFYQSYNPEFGYNICPTAGSCLGMKHTEKTKKKISEIHLGKLKSEEHKKKLSEAHEGMKYSEEHKKKLSEAHKGRVCSIETRKKIGEANKGKERSGNIKKKISEMQKGRLHSEETKKKMSEAHKGKRLSEEHKQKLSEIHNGEKNHSAKLTWEKVREIRRRYKGKKITQEQLSKEYNVAKFCIWKVLRGLTWKEES